MIRLIRSNYKVYLMEAICLGLFMISASFFGTLLEYSGSWVNQAIPDSFVRLCCMGIAMGVTAALLIYSPMGKLSGAHMNPAVSFTFVYLQKMKTADALWYTVFQLAGGVAAVYLMSLLLGDAFKDSHVNYVITAPGRYGAQPAFISEVVIAFIMMLTVLIASNHDTLSKYTGIFSGVLVCCYVILSGPISGFGMNPARTLASAIPAMQFPSLWIYLTAPFIGMLGASFLYTSLKQVARCAKLHHDVCYKCIFDCGYCTHSHETTNEDSSAIDISKQN